MGVLYQGITLSFEASTWLHGGVWRRRESSPDDFVGRLAADPQLKRFFTGLSTDSQKKLRQHVVDFLCSATGGPCVYTGRDMKTAHTGLGITEDDWSATVKHLVATLDKFKVPEKEKNEVLGAISGLKGDIVGR